MTAADKPKVGIKMKKVICCLAMLCILLCGCGKTKMDYDFQYSYDKEEYPRFCNTLCIEMVYIPSDHYGLEYMLMEVLKGAENGLIAECVVTGNSANQINLRPDYQDPNSGEQRTDTISSHVLTPIKIEKIYYKGSEVALKPGDEVILREDFFYITDVTPDMQKLFDTQQGVYTYQYNPVVKDQRYILYLQLEDYFQRDVEDRYPLPEGTPVVNPYVYHYCAFPVGDRETVAKDLIFSDDVYWEMWEKTMELYLNYDGPLPLEAPLAFASKPAVPW